MKLVKLTGTRGDG